MRPWIFRAYGLIEQYQMDGEADLARIDALDEARWTATSAPLEQYNLDPAFLTFLDTDGDRRVRVRELQEARRWLWGMLQDRAGVTAGSDVLTLAHLSPDSAEAEAVRRLAEHLLVRLEAPRQDAISLAQIRQFQQVYVARYPNGDGLVTAAQVPEALQAVLAEVLAATGGATDLSGAPGVSAGDVDVWLERVGAWLAWQARREAEADVLLPLGADTGPAAALIARLAPKVAQYFAQCDLLRLESRAAERLRASPEELAALDVADPAAIRAWLAQAALAAPDPSGLLPLQGAINGSYAADLDRLAQDIAPRLLGQAAPVMQLSPETWARLQAAVQPWLDWQAAEPTGLERAGGADHLRGWLSSPDPGALRALAEGDTAIADELVQFRSLERVACLQRYLLLFANNFVSFPDLFSGDRRALFELGTLIIDGRRVNLCVRVSDIAAHKKLAAESLLFLAYVKLTRREGSVEQSETVAAAVTAGTRGGIAVGKRGVFYDREGREWDALVVDIIAQPISVWEAMIDPLLRLRDALATRLEAAVSSRATDSEAALGKQTDAAAATATATPTPAAAETSADSGASRLTNLLMGGTIAFAAAGSALTLLIRTIASIPLLHLLGALGGVVAVVMGLSGLLGWLRLRRRDLATLLEACGFALNGRMYLSPHLARIFTHRPGLPAGAVRRLATPRSRTGWVVLVLVLLLLGLVVAAALSPEVRTGLEALFPATPAAEPPAAP